MSAQLYQIVPGSIVASRRYGNYTIRMSRHADDTWQVVFAGPTFTRCRASRDDLYIREQYQRYTLFGWLLASWDRLRPFSGRRTDG